MSEASALEEWSDEGYEFHYEEQQQQYQNKLYAMSARYADNASSAVGTTIRCACCAKRILKNNYQTQFCSNRGSGNCKDKYWNNVSDSRRSRAKYFAN